MSYPVPQTDPPKSPRETLPTMYDLPSENPEEPGLPDEFHDLQPQLLSQTFVPPEVTLTQIYTASDLNLYYDVRHPQWYKTSVRVKTFFGEGWSWVMGNWMGVLASSGTKSYRKRKPPSLPLLTQFPDPN
jgi:hypothetical protein